MNAQKIYAMFAAASLALVAAAASIALPASAATVSAAVGTTANAGTATGIVAAQANADAEINARVTALNALETRIGQMVKVSATEKANLDATIQSSLTAMSTLEAKINADTTSASLKADVQSITKSYRIYVLVVPQGRIVAEADRVMTIVSLMQTLSTQLQARITAAQASGQNVTTLNASLSGMNAKTADANVQAQAAVAEVSGLQPDNGSATVYQSNAAALKGARAKLVVAVADLKTARQDAGSIVKALEAMKVSATAPTATAGASAAATTTVK